MAGTRTEDMDTIQKFLDNKPVQLSPDELAKEELVAQQEENFGSDAPPPPEEATAPPPPGMTQAEAEKIEAETRLRSEKAEAARQREEEKRRKGMEALQKQQAKLAEKQRHKATVEAARHGLPGPLGLVAEAAHGPVELVQNTASDVGRDLERISTPGSILLPVAILIMLFLAVIPVNGYPRLAWLWFVMTGNASLSGTPGPMAASELAPMPPPTPQQQEQASWDAHRQQVAYHSFTGMEDGDF